MFEITARFIIQGVLKMPSLGINVAILIRSWNYTSLVVMSVLHEFSLDMGCFKRHATPEC